MDDVSRIFEAFANGDDAAGEQLLPVIYAELRKLAARQMAAEPAGHTLSATALVHEAYLRLVPSPQQGWQNRAHFFGAAAEAMRRILIDRARRKRRLKHGGILDRVSLDPGLPAPASSPDWLLDLDAVLNRFEAVDPVKARLVKLRYFAGLSVEETATVMGISRATADRYWVYARAWLFDALGDARPMHKK